MNYHNFYIILKNKTIKGLKGFNDIDTNFIYYDDVNKFYIDNNEN